MSHFFFFGFRVLKYWWFTEVSRGTAHGASHMCYYAFCWTVSRPRRLTFIQVRYFIVPNVRSLFISPWKMLYIFNVPTRLQMATPKHKEFTSSINEVKQWSMFRSGWRFWSPIVAVSNTNTNNLIYIYIYIYVVIYRWNSPWTDEGYD